MSDRVKILRAGALYQRAQKASQCALQADVEGGVLMMRAPVGRGLVAIGNAAGQLVLTDPRAGVHHLTTSDIYTVLLICFKC